MHITLGAKGVHGAQVRQRHVLRKKWRVSDQHANTNSTGTVVMETAAVWLVEAQSQSESRQSTTSEPASRCAATQHILPLLTAFFKPLRSAHAHTCTTPSQHPRSPNLCHLRRACCTMKPSPFAALSAAVLLCVAHLTHVSATTPPIPGTWMLAGMGLSCDEACAARPNPAPCHLASLQSVTSNLAFDRLRDSLLNHTALNCLAFSTNDRHAPSLDAMLVSYHGFNSCSLGSGASTCDAAEPTLRRFCCCGDTQCTNEYVPRWQTEGLNIPAPVIYNQLDEYVLWGMFDYNLTHRSFCSTLLNLDLAVCCPVECIALNHTINCSSFRAALSHPSTPLSNCEDQAFHGTN
jgi:hypothetical protein